MIGHGWIRNGITTADLESKFAFQFRELVTLPVPEPMTKFKKVYPSVIRKS